MALRPAAVLSVGLLLLLIHEAVTKTGLESLPIRLTVENDLSNMTPESYFTSVVEGGVLLGALRRLQETQPDFKFTVKEDPDFGVFLESVNGVAGDEHKQTYWEILSENSGEYTRLGVDERKEHRICLGMEPKHLYIVSAFTGVGCYSPKADEHIVLRFSTWNPSKEE